MGVPEREPARALVEFVIPADHGLVPRKHHAEECEACKDAAADAAQHVPRLARPHVPAVAVKGAGRVVGGRDDESGVGVRRLATFFRSWARKVNTIIPPHVLAPAGEGGARRDLPSSVEEPRGTAPESTIPVRPRPRRANPSDLAKYSSSAFATGQHG